MSQPPTATVPAPDAAVEPETPELAHAAPPQPRLFYGWVMLGIAMATAIATMPGQTVLVSLFNASYREALRISEVEISTAYMFGTIIASLPLALVGRAADRFGLRRVTGIVAVLFAGALVAMTQVWSIWALGVGFLLIRFLGQGSLSMLSGHSIAMWFERRLGTAHAILAVGGFAAGSAILPIPTAALIDRLGWQAALVVLAGMVVVLVVPAVLFLFRNRPEDVGQNLDGDPAPHERHDVIHGGAPPIDDPAFTIRQAMTTFAYWIVVANMVAVGLVGTALLFHMQPLLQIAGAEGTAKQAALAIQPWPIAFGCGVLLSGFLADRFHARAMLPIGGLLMMVSCVVAYIAISDLSPASSAVALMGGSMAIFGIAQSLVFGVGNPTIARYFGRTHHGAIRGTISTAVVAGTGAGPFALSIGQELMGGTLPVLVVFALSGLPLAVLAAFITRPAPRPRPVGDTPDADIDDPVEL